MPSPALEELSKQQVHTMTILRRWFVVLMLLAANVFMHFISTRLELARMNDNIEYLTRQIETHLTDHQAQKLRTGR